MKRSEVVAALKLDEGFRAKPYKDTQGVWTVGYGRNLEAEGLTEAEATMLLEHDVESVEGALQRLVAPFVILSAARQMVLVNMAVNVGVLGFMKFKKMRAALDMGDFERAANEILDSDAARENVARYKRLAAIMRVG